MPKSVAGRFRKIGCAGVFAITAILGHAGSAGATVWQDGDEITYGQGLWALPATDGGAELLAADFDTVYASTGGVIVGSTSGFTMIFTSSANVLAYLPSINTPAPLNSNVVNPMSTASGEFGGDVLVLAFNVDFSDAGFLTGTSGIPFGDLILTGFSATLPQLDGLTVRQFLGDMNTLLSGGSSIVTIDELYDGSDGPIPALLDTSFSSGTPSQFAQDHLEAPTVTSTPVPEPSSLAILIAGLFGAAMRRHRLRVQANCLKS